jgi:recombinational DNA repair protein (RecF pathway)
VAKGVRKISSSKRAFLEPGNHVRCLLINTNSMPLLTQATLIDDCSEIHSTLPKIRQLVQLLEIIDALFVEDQEEGLFDKVLKIRSEIVKPGPTNGKIKQYLDELIVELGYQHPQETTYSSLLEYVSALADRPIRSWEYLKT